MDPPRILAAEPGLLAPSVFRSLVAEGVAPVVAAGAGEAAARLRAEPWDVFLADLDGTGAELLAEALEATEPPAVLLLASFGSAMDSVEALRRGAFDVLARPMSDDQILLALRRALDQRELAVENRTLREQLDERDHLEGLRTRSPRMRRVLETARAVADTRASVLVRGESGTGKTLLARALHRASPRRDGPFVEVSCGALPDALLESELFGHARGAFSGAVRDRIGKFEAADGGTLFLDEIGTASLDLQVKLLRVLESGRLERVGETETRSADVRLIAATNDDLEARVAEGAFREDLYWRVHVVAVELPPLRERPEDVPLLAEHFARRFQLEHRRGARAIRPDAMAELVRAPWPGNVRQLAHVLERAVLLCGGAEITPADLALGPLPEGAAEEREAGEVPLGPLRPVLERVERRLIESTLELHDGSRSRTAAALGINRTTLFNKMRKHGLDRAGRRAGG